MKTGKPIHVVAACVLAALLFNTWIYFFMSPTKALEFFTAYVIELSLSVDNLFVFFMIFSHFKIGIGEQQKILSWGIWGAQLMRALFILAGVSMLTRWAWVGYVFGAVLLIAGIKLFFKGESSVDIEENTAIKFLKRVFSLKLSPFVMALIAVELADVIFAIDSIPAVLAVSRDVMVVYTSNIFAILGLRAMYMVLSGMAIDMFEYLHYTLGIILIFIGFKMLIDHFWHMPITITLGFVVTALGFFIFMSYLKSKGKNI